jgi:hypothetical protein
MFVARRNPESRNAGHGYDMVGQLGVENHGTDERIYSQEKPVV